MGVGDHEIEVIEAGSLRGVDSVGGATYDCKQINGLRIGNACIKFSHMKLASHPVHPQKSS